MVITATLSQALAVSRALDVYTRLAIAQPWILAEMIQMGEVSTRGLHDNDAIRSQCENIGRALGYGNGASAGIGRAPINASRAYEVNKVLLKALAVHRDPAPKFHGVDYDGLIVRHTKDPAPHVVIATSSNEKESK